MATRDIPQDLYELLGVPENATSEQLKRAYRTQAGQWHPDGPRKDRSGERFKAIVAAYEILTDPSKRAEYDRARHQASRDKPTDGHGATDRSPPPDPYFAPTSVEWPVTDDQAVEPVTVWLRNRGGPVLREVTPQRWEGEFWSADDADLEPDGDEDVWAYVVTPVDPAASRLGTHHDVFSVSVDGQIVSLPIVLVISAPPPAVPPPSRNRTFVVGLGVVLLVAVGLFIHGLVQHGPRAPTADVPRRQLRPRPSPLPTYASPAFAATAHPTGLGDADATWTGGSSGDDAYARLHVRSAVHGFTLALQVKVAYASSDDYGDDLRGTVANYCVQIQTPDQNGYSGAVYGEAPLTADVTTHGNAAAATLVYSFVLPGSYYLSESCSDDPSAPEVGSNDAPSLGVAAGGETRNALAVFGERKGKRDLVLDFGAIGGNYQGEEIHPGTNVCITDGEPPTDGGATIWHPERVHVIKRVDSGGQSYELGTFTFSSKVAEASTREFYFNCDSGDEGVALAPR